MATYQTRGAWQAAQGGTVETLADIDFTALGADDWTAGGATRTLGGETWSLLNQGTTGGWGPDGTNLVWLPSSGSGWYASTRSGSALAISLSTLDASVDDDARYAAIIEIPSWPASLANYARIGVSFWDPGTAGEYYGVACGPGHIGSDCTYGSQYAASDVLSESATTRRSFAIVLEPTGFCGIYVSSTPSVDLIDFTPLGAVRAGALVNYTRTTLRTKPSVANVGIVATGLNGKTFNFNRLTVQKYPGA